MLQKLRSTINARLHARRALRITLENARQRAGRGASLLDDRDPGWAARVNPRSLELSDGAACVLGQLHGEFRSGLRRARIIDLSSAPLASLSPVDLGFQAVRHLGDEIERRDFAYLNRAWREEVTRRRPRQPVHSAGARVRIRSEAPV
jgi:hypothetical protein